MVPPPSKGAAAASTLNVADAGAAAEAAEDTVGCATTTNDDHGDADEQPSFRTNPGQQDDDAGSSASNDDDESDEDESEEDDADGPPAPPLSLAEIREWKLRRNQAKMVELGLASKSPRTIRFADSHRSKRKRNKRGNPSLIGRREDEQQHSVRRGMLLPPIDGWGESRAGSAVADTPTRQQEKINQLYDKYPHRHRQVRTLLGLLRPMMSAGSTTRDNTNCSVPPPIFAVGPSGTGKTSVVRDVLDALHCSEMASAYVNCAALDAPNLRAVTRPLLRQLQHHIHATVSATTTRPDNLSARANDDSNADSPTASEKQGTGCCDCFSTHS